MRERRVRLHWIMARYSLLSMLPFSWSFAWSLSWPLLLLLPVIGLPSSAHAQTVPQVLESGYDWQRNVEGKPEPEQERNSQRELEREQARNTEHKPETKLVSSELPYEASANDFALIATLETDRKSAYVNEQILLTLTVSVPAIAFNITGTQLGVAHAELVSLHRQESVEQINGTAYQTSRTVYALFARDSGTLQLPTLTFKAVLPVGAGSDTRSATANAGITSSTNPIITGSTAAFQLSIEKAPSTDTLWFPAQAVELSSSWSVDTGATNAVHAGEPVTRHVTIQVAGQHPAAIPASVMPVPEGVRVYPELPQLDTQVSPTGLNGTRIDSAEIIASHAGTITLPAIDVPWWDINRREWRISSLPAEQLRVQAASTDVSPTMLATNRWYRQILAGGFVAIATLSVICLLLWRSNRRLLATNLLKQGTAGPDKPICEHAAWARLQRDIRRKDLPGIRCSLLSWGQSLGPTAAVQTLDQLASTWPALKPILQALDAALYSQHTRETPALDQLLKELKLLRTHVKSRSAPANVSMTLYP